MSSQQLQFPEQVRARLEKLYANNKHVWTTDHGIFPLEINLGCPTEQQAIDQRDTVLSWVKAWREWHGHGELVWQTRQWRRIGVQTLPEKIVFDRPQQLAEFFGERDTWQRVVERYAVLTNRWPNISKTNRDLFEALAELDASDFDILQRVVAWLLEHPSSGLYPRQIPVVGAHTKWLDGKLGTVCALLTSICGRDRAISGLSLLGLRERPALWRLRILDEELRQKVGLLEDISAPIDDLRRLQLSPGKVIIVENLQTFLAFDDLPDTVVLLGMGFGVKEIATISWVQTSGCHYWGDLDTAGFAILDLARSIIPKIRSVLMDEQTLLAHRQLWVSERKQQPAETLPHLTAAEAQVYQDLKKQRWSTNVRLEQERLPWDIAWRAVADAVGSDVALVPGNCR